MDFLNEKYKILRFSQDFQQVQNTGWFNTRYRSVLPSEVMVLGNKSSTEVSIGSRWSGDSL